MPKFLSSPLSMFYYVDRPKGKAPVGGISIFGAVTDELTGGSTSAAPEPSTVTTTPAPTKSVTSTVSVINYLIAHMNT